MHFRISSFARLSLVVVLIIIGSATVAPEAVAAGAETLILNVDGMWAEGCEEYISGSLLGDIEGVQQVNANHEDDSVTVEFDPALASAEEIAAAIEDCPHFDVTGSETHELNKDLIKRSRRSCCHGSCRDRDI